MIRARRAGLILAFVTVGALTSGGCGEDGNDANGATPVVPARSGASAVAPAAATDGGAIPAPATTNLELDDFSLAPDALDVAAGTEIALSNSGANQHDLVVEGTDVASHLLDPGTAGTLDTSSLAPGTYVVYCSITGHREAGMEGTLTIT